MHFVLPRLSIPFFDGYDTSVSVYILNASSTYNLITPHFKLNYVQQESQAEMLRVYTTIYQTMGTIWIMYRLSGKSLCMGMFMQIRSKPPKSCSFGILISYLYILKAEQRILSFNKMFGFSFLTSCLTSGIIHSSKVFAFL